ncbi:MAG: alanine racemase [Actinomycetota bacterium]
MTTTNGLSAARRATRADIELAALRANVQSLAVAAGTSELWAVVKANAYGHGAVPCAQAALSAGAHGLCVALTQEALELRDAGIGAPIMVLSEQPVADIPLLVRNDVICVAYNAHYIAELAAESERFATQLTVSKRAVHRTLVHLKVDTGMHRVGVAPTDAVERAKMITSAASLELHGVMTHLATADDPAQAATQRQLDEFRRVLAEIRRVAPSLRHVHVANSAATLRKLLPECTMVRAGIALYGLNPGDGVASLARGLRPVMTLRTEVLHVQRLRAGEGVSYGLRTVLSRDTTVATLPIGYADGIARRAWQTPARILVGGKPRRILGVVTMDQLMVDCEDDTVTIGDEAVIFGSQAEAAVRVEDWATALDTITYEVVCAISARVPRHYSEA